MTDRAAPLLSLAVPSFMPQICPKRGKQWCPRAVLLPAAQALVPAYLEGRRQPWAVRTTLLTISELTVILPAIKEAAAEAMPERRGLPQ